MIQIYIANLLRTSKYKEKIKTREVFSIYDGRQSNNCTDRAFNKLSLVKVEGGSVPFAYYRRGHPPCTPLFYTTGLQIRIPSIFGHHI